MFQSQPVPQLSHGNDLDMPESNGRVDFCYSQPALMDDLILCTQLNSTQGTSQNVFQRLVKRMTRFYVTIKIDEAIKRLSTAVEDLGCTWKTSDGSVVNISIQTKKQQQIVQLTDNNLLSFFILAAGDHIDDRSPQTAAGIQSLCHRDGRQYHDRFPLIKRLWPRIQTTFC